MPSLWQWLCCSRRRFASRKERRRQKTLAERQNAYIVSAPEDHLVTASSGHAQSSPASTSPGGSDPAGGGVDANGNSVVEKLLEAENNRNRKRRRVDEIFRHQSARESAAAGDLFRLRDRVFKSDRSLSETDTMYGYVPRAMQGMFVSTALEGYKVEDYLPNSKTNRDIDRFCSLPTVNNDNGSTPRPATDSHGGSSDNSRRQDNGLRSNNTRFSSNGVHSNDDDVFPVTQHEFNVSSNVTSVTPRFPGSAVTNLDDIDVVMETNADDVSNMDVYLHDVTKAREGGRGGGSDFTRNGVERGSNTEWLHQTRKKLDEPKGLTVNSDIENIFGCDGEVLY